MCHQLIIKVQSPGADGGGARGMGEGQSVRAPRPSSPLSPAPACPPTPELEPALGFLDASSCKGE